jgi:hypothetical protein
MVAKVITGKTIKGVLNYNEYKVRDNKAVCIDAAGFLLERDEMTFHDKLHAFEELTNRNLMAKTNAVHISLNFDPSEKLSQEKLSEITAAYMNGIGFGDQPYLVYQHFDAAHPHVHIVTTNIQGDGNRIDLHNVGRKHSEPTRKKIETEFGLVRAESKSKVQKEFIQAIDVQKAVYGKSETKRSISNIVRMVTRSYKYTSLPELNAILKQYNVVADRGKEGTQMFTKNGLIYSLIDKQGKRIGIPVKASAIYGKPMLSFLQRQFTLNETLRQPHKAQLKTSIDKLLQSAKPISQIDFSEKLKHEGIDVLFRENEEGRIYGVTFVDNRSKTVFNGSDLGRSYSAKGILEKLSSAPVPTSHFRPGFSPVPTQASKGSRDIKSNSPSIVDDILAAETPYTISPEAALRLRKKKRKRSL